MSAALARLRKDLGALGMASLAILAGAAALHFGMVRPQEARLAAVRAELDARASVVHADRVRPMSAAGRLATFHDFFRREESTVDWLAKLHGTALSHGIELRTADYRHVASQGRLDRYQVSVPLSGTYPRIRHFLEDALVELPVMSLDHVAFRRKRATDAVVEAEATFTLHLHRP